MPDRPSGSTFTGRTRRRTTRPRARLADAVARGLITIGGIGTIVAVLLVGAFLLAVALPLFRSARFALERSGPLPEPPAAGALACLGGDESGVLAWVANRDDAGGIAGEIRLVRVADGESLQSLPAASCDLEGATVVRMGGAGSIAVVGYGDGTFRTGTVGLESRFLGPEDLPDDARNLAPGSASTVAGRTIVRGESGHHAEVSFVSRLGPPSRLGPAAIVDIDVASRSDGQLVAALDAAGRVRVEAIAERRNLLTDEVVSTAAGSTIEPESGFQPRFVRVSERGDQLFLVALDGAARRLSVRDAERPEPVEAFRALPPSAGEATAVERLFGGAALAVGDTAGGVRILFASRGGEGAGLAGDGLRMQVARSFPPPAGPRAEVRAIAPSSRSRLFAVADAARRIRLLQSTTGSVVLAPQPEATAPIERLFIAPRDNLLLAAGTGALAAWRIDAGYPEISPRTLLGRVWYENYPRPLHAWETTGHDSFEPKFGLVPLVFGTIKATLYTMLFATPIAVLAAIYASQFLHPRWRARIKPTIELMAGLPSVVLGFVAGMILAPLVERGAMPVMTGLFLVPLVLVTAAHLWLFLPSGWRPRLAPWRPLVIGTLVLPLGCLASVAAAPLVEGVLFDGDLRGWLDGQGGSGFGGWVVALLPPAAAAAAVLTGRFVMPWLRRVTPARGAGRGGWSERQAAVAGLAVFLAGVLLAVTLAAAGAAFLDALRIDSRGGLFGTYVQRNALVVALGMSFAIIPLIFTIADDALTSVPDHLRSASLGAGATPWQTAIRVIVPAAASGIFSAVMIGLGRAVGETMIVLMAAGNTPITDWNVFNGFQTLSAAIATELPEAARGSAHYRVLFLAALALFAMTFVVNTVAELVRQRFRRRAHEL